MGTVWVPIEHLDVVIAIGQLVHRHGHHVVIDLVVAALVQIVSDSGAVGQEVLDSYPIIH